MAGNNDEVIDIQESQEMTVVDENEIQPDEKEFELKRKVKRSRWSRRRSLCAPQAEPVPGTNYAEAFAQAAGDGDEVR